MCGITGIFAFNELGRINMINLANATASLAKRGPDFQNTYTDNFIGLGHRRLSVIDPSPEAHQPIGDDTGRYQIVFNGEIYNYKELRKELRDQGYTFSTESDTEVLLKLFIEYRDACLNKLDGFFSFCIYDKSEETFFIARDRFGIKPLCYYIDEDKFLFSSTVDSLTRYGVEKKIDKVALFQYAQLNYISSPRTIYEHVKKLNPGEFLTLKNREIKVNKWYGLENNGQDFREKLNYQKSKERLVDLVEESVQKRLVSDVPLGTFLSGGIDSSIITGIASKYLNEVNSFSIGYKDEPFFDETNYAEIASKHFKTHHTVFKLSNEDLFEHLTDTLDSFDQPFADSSALPVKILSRLTRKHVTVALSGDGADEVFSGYNKHKGFYKSLNQSLDSNLVKTLLPVLELFPSSRNGTFSNKIRQLIRYGKGIKLSLPERYYLWASFISDEETILFFSKQFLEEFDKDKFEYSRAEWLSKLSAHSDMNDVLLTDMELILPNDMLTKVDLMSMSESLEVRVPFLDHNVVEYAFSLPPQFKIDGKMKKKILQDAFRDFLPSELYKRPKHGFEVPLLRWFRTELKSKIKSYYLDADFIKEQAIFDPSEIEKIKKQLFSNSPGDVHARIWGLIVFQHWWRKEFD